MGVSIQKDALGFLWGAQFKENIQGGLSYALSWSLALVKKIKTKK